MFLYLYLFALLRQRVLYSTRWMDHGAFGTLNLWTFWKHPKSPTPPPPFQPMGVIAHIFQQAGFRRKQGVTFPFRTGPSFSGTNHLELEQEYFCNSRDIPPTKRVSSTCYQSCFLHMAGRSPHWRGLWLPDGWVDAACLLTRRTVP